MSNSEFLAEKSREKHFFNRENVVLNAASIALAATLAGCTPTGALPERNTPAESSYSLDTAPEYYMDVESMKQYTDDPATEEKLDALADQPVAKWLVDEKEETFNELRTVMQESAENGTVPILVAYHIPNRDLGSYSSGGAGDAQNYSAWTETISAAIGNQPAVVIVEPDAVAQLPDMDTEAAALRIELLAGAIHTFSTNEQTAVYLDLGNSAWLPPDEAAGLLTQVQEKAEAPITGISLNVSNFISEEETRAYADEVQNAFGQKLYVMIDNSRNGAPDAVSGWCNPEGQRLGEADHTYDPSQQVETAFIKTPGQSDGECGISERPAGEFDGELLFHQLGQ